MSARAFTHQLRLGGWALLATLGTCLSLGPLIEDRRYLVHAGGLLVLAVLTGATLRGLHVHRPLVFLVQVVLAAELAVLAYTDSRLPTPTAIGEIRDGYVRFAENAQLYTAPMPSDASATMSMALIIVVLGLVVDLIGVTYRRVPLLGLVFLLVYMVPVAQLAGDVSVFAFIPGAAAFVFLLAADERERLTHWGHQIAMSGRVWSQGSAEVDDSGLRQSRYRIGFGAVALAALLPFVVPSVDPQILFDGGSGGELDGRNGGVDVENPVLDMRRNLSQTTDEVLLRIQTDDPEPGYLRLAALDRFTGDEWTVGFRPTDDAADTTGALPGAPGQVASVLSVGREYEVQVTDALRSDWLPVVYSPARVEVEGEWLVDPTHVDIRRDDGQDDSSGLRYSFRSTVSDPTQDQLQFAPDAPSALAQFTTLPSGFSPEIRELTAQVTGNTTNGFSKALALQQYFRDPANFEYDLAQADDGENGEEAIEDFLLNTQVGYCEQFASAMALMARVEGIPSRVAIGFLRPSDSRDGWQEFRGQDMHAWPELYFEGVGWVRFEPTPASQGATAPNFDTGGPDDPSATPTETLDPNDTQTTRVQQDPFQPNRDDDPAAGLGDDAGLWGAIRIVLPGLLLLGALAVLPRALREMRRRRRWSGATSPVAAAEAAWSELRDSMVDLRLPWDDRDTPRHLGRALRVRIDERRRAPVITGPTTEQAVQALNTLVVAVEQGRYARTAAAVSGLRQAERTVVEAITDTRTPSVRRRSTWLPRSVLRRPGADRSASRARGHAPGEAVLSLRD
ncbi:MAG: DUF3488 and transglutaminase-like domain-containing protein [Actinomycetota bacterium]|nr:DUF3488 and transglutaminase-like domain-containing protein [Actinomycetota bacterium]